jgi:fibronectin-binding autotransporter adhesin
MKNNLLKKGTKKHNRKFNCGFFMHQFIKKIIPTILTALTLTFNSQAQTDTWTGATSSDWSTGSNWSLGYAPTSANMARFMWSTANAPTLGAGSFITTKMYFFSSGALPNYTFTGAGSANTTLKIDPNSGSTVSFIENGGSTSGGINQTFSNLTLLLQDSNLTGQTKIQPGDGRSVTIASNATLQIGSTTAQAVILEANSPQTGSGTLNINGVLNAGVTGSTISVEKSGVLNLNLAAGSDFTNLELSSKNGGVINFLAGGGLGGSVSIYSGGVANVATSGIILDTTQFSIVSGGKISTTYTSGTSTLGGLLSLANGTGGPTSTFDVASGGILALTNRVQLGSASAIVEKTGNGTLALTYSGGTGNSFTASAFNVKAGTLLVNNIGNTTASAAAVNIFSGATLAGAGRITGATTISGILAPGNSIGTLTVANDVTWNGSLLGGDATTDWKFELGAANTADLLQITGAESEFIKGTGTTFRFDFLGSTATGTFKLVDWDSIVPWTGGEVAGTNFSIADFTYTNLGGSNLGTFQFNGTQLEFQAIPEPSAVSLMILGVASLFVLRRIKNL